MSHSTANIHDWRDDMEFFDHPKYGLRLVPMKPKVEFLQNGDRITVPMTMMDAATARIPPAPLPSPSDPTKLFSFIDTSPEGGKAWLERGRLQREAWKTCSYHVTSLKPDTHPRTEAYVASPLGSKSPTVDLATLQPSVIKPTMSGAKSSATPGAIRSISSAPKSGRSYPLRFTN